MADNTLTFALEGEVPLEEFATAVRHFTDLVSALSREIGGGKPDIEWIVIELEGGSARATIEGFSPNTQLPSMVADAYFEVGTALERNIPITRSPRVQQEALAITKVINSHIRAVRFETARGVANVVSGEGESPSISFAIGAVEGMVETLSSRGARLRFTIYDTIFDKAINCYINKGQEEIVRGIWGKPVIVTGRIGRDPEHGRAVVVYDVEKIKILDEPSGRGYEHSAGALLWSPGDDLPEQIIRRIRNYDE